MRYSASSMPNALNAILARNATFGLQSWNSTVLRVERRDLLELAGVGRTRGPSAVSHGRLAGLGVGHAVNGGVGRGRARSGRGAPSLGASADGAGRRGRAAAHAARTIVATATSAIRDHLGRRVMRLAPPECAGRALRSAAVRWPARQRGAVAGDREPRTARGRRLLRRAPGGTLTCPRRRHGWRPEPSTGLGSRPTPPARAAARPRLRACNRSASRSPRSRPGSGTSRTTSPATTS